MNKTGEIEIGERINSFERAETNEVKWLRHINRPGVDLHCTIICINFQVVFLRITSENVQPSTQFMKKYSSYIFLLNHGRCIF